MRILSINHVQIAIPFGSQDRARAFYVGILGLSEVAKPEAMAERKSIWFTAGEVNLHLGMEMDFHPARRAHPAVVVEGLDEILASCERAGVSVKPDVSFDGFRRVHVFDPFGNRLELMERIRQ
jgi:catechol 2,3-dioxygenase-like lactoylglutathione lyase family enzyme